MKRSFLLCFVFTIISVSVVTAQNLRLAVSAGVDASKMAISGASGGPLNYRHDLSGGLAFEAGLSSTFALQLEANYSPQGAGVINDDATTAGSYQLNYITVPLLAKLYATPKLSFYAGPQVGLLISAKTKSSGQEDTDVKDQLTSTDFAAVFGGEYRFANGVFISTRYNLGLANAIEDETTNTEIKNRYFSFRIGYSFALGK
jgi:hypothetical protein